MQRRHRFPWPCVLAVLFLVGCENSPLGEPEPAPPRPPAAPAPAAQSVPQPAPDAAKTSRTAEASSGPAAQPPANAASQPPGNLPPPRFQPLAPPAAASDDPMSLVRLSAGVALPQTGPTGVMMSFSVDYTFTRSGPDPATRYAWVIRRGGGKPLNQPVELKAKGTLQAFVPGWRPEEGPFEAFLLEIRADGSQSPISVVVPLR